jgi:long-subunit fatty acid transport protein
MKVIARWINFSTAFLLCVSTGTFADEFHYNNLLIGDRASGMGGAYTAISDDASGMYYNPAGIVYVTDKNFSASVNAYSAQTKTYEKVIGGQPFVRKSSALLANYFGIVKPIGQYKFGFSYAVPDSVSEDLNQTVRNVPSTISDYDFTINLNNRDNTYYFGPSFAMAINNDLALGITLYVHQRDTLIIQNQFLARVDGTNQWSNSYFKLNESGLRPILGVTWSPVEKLSLGVSLSKTFLLTSNATRQDTCVDTTATGCDVNAFPAIPFQVPTLTSFDVKRKYPLRAAIGAAYFASSSLLVSTDIIYHTQVDDPVFGNKVATMDAALGAEYYLSKKWAVRAGLFSNVANTPTIQAGVTNIEENINLYGGSLSFTHFTGDSSVTLGGSLSYGVGKAQIGTSSTDVQDASTFGWTMFLSSSY